jgi:hypothetical protein
MSGVGLWTVVVLRGWVGAHLGWSASQPASWGGEFLRHLISIATPLWCISFALLLVLFISLPFSFHFVVHSRGLRA